MGVEIKFDTAFMTAVQFTFINNATYIQLPSVPPVTGTVAGTTELPVTTAGVNVTAAWEEEEAVLTCMTITVNGCPSEGMCTKKVKRGYNLGIRFPKNIA